MQNFPFFKAAATHSQHRVSENNHDFWAKKHLTIVVYLCGIYEKIIVKKLTLSNFNFEKFEFT